MAYPCVLHDSVHPTRARALGDCMFSRCTQGFRTQGTVQYDHPRFRWTGLLGVALVYAMAPAGAYGVCLSIVNHYVRSEKNWSKAMSIVEWSLGPTLAADGVLGLPLFTNVEAASKMWNKVVHDSYEK